MKRYHWLAALPTIIMLGGVPFANRVTPYIFGLPFLLAWIVMSVLATSLILAIIYALDMSGESEAMMHDHPDRSSAR
jgi:hypothetical protein